jgi:hypothetical protein
MRRQVCCFFTDEFSKRRRHDFWTVFPPKIVWARELFLLASHHYVCVIPCGPPYAAFSGNSVREISILPIMVPSSTLISQDLAMGVNH